MTYSTYGYGISSNDSGSIVTFGLGKVLISPIINASIDFDINLQSQFNKQLNTYKNIFITTSLSAEELNNLTANANVILGTQLDLSSSKQLDAEANILFDTNLDLQALKQLITTAQLSIDIGLDLNFFDFILDPNAIPQNVYIIPEELRFLPIFVELRRCIVEEQSRMDTIEFEDRKIIISEGD